MTGSSQPLSSPVTTPTSPQRHHNLTMSMCVQEKERLLLPTFEHFKNLFFTYGTHAVQSVDLGGKMISQKHVSRSAYDSASSSGVDMASSVSAEVSSTFASGGMEASMEYSTAEEETFSQAVASSRSSTFVVGGSVPPGGAGSDGGFSDWAASVDANPMPVRYQLLPLDMLSGAIAGSWESPPPPPPPPTPPDNTVDVHMKGGVCPLAIIVSGESCTTDGLNEVCDVSLPGTNTAYCTWGIRQGVPLCAYCPQMPPILMDEHSISTSGEPMVVGHVPEEPLGWTSELMASDCHLGIAHRATMVRVAKVQVNSSDLSQALRQCWAAVREASTSPPSPPPFVATVASTTSASNSTSGLSTSTNTTETYAIATPAKAIMPDGLQLGVGEGAEGQCIALYGLEGYKAELPQHADWVTCQPGGLLKVFAFDDPPPPPLPPPPPPPSPPDFRPSADAILFTEAYRSFLPMYGRLSRQTPHRHQVYAAQCTLNSLGSAARTSHLYLPP